MKVNRIVACLIQGSFCKALPCNEGDWLKIIDIENTPPESDIPLEEMEIRAWSFYNGPPPESYYQIEEYLECLEKSL
jgi:hypothetical protein